MYNTHDSASKERNTFKKLPGQVGNSVIDGWGFASNVCAVDKTTLFNTNSFISASFYCFVWMQKFCISHL